MCNVVANAKMNHMELLSKWKLEPYIVDIELNDHRYEIITT